MTPMTLPSRSDVRIANAARPTLRKRIESPGVPGTTGQQSFAYFHIRKLARRFVNDPARLAQWWECDGIEELGALTPAQLLAAGQHGQLEALLLKRIAQQQA